MTSINSTVSKRMRWVLLAGLIAAYATLAMILTPTAHAEKIPESTIKSECQQAGGTYTTGISDGKRYSTCCYKDENGQSACDS